MIKLLLLLSSFIIISVSSVTYRKCVSLCKPPCIRVIWRKRFKRCELVYRKPTSYPIVPITSSPFPFFIHPLFNQVFPNHPCETYRPDPSRDFRTIQNVSDLNDCLRIGEYDSNCGGLLYFPTNQTCIKASRIQLTDVEFPPKTDQIAFYRKSVTFPSYYAGYCSLYDTKETCNESKFCGWKQGRQGINQHRIVDLGWCGRIGCNHSQI